jgi:hypothetical protein
MSRSTEEKPLRTAAEKQAASGLAAAFEQSPDPVGMRLESFPKYVRRQDLTRLLARYEIFKRVLPIKGSIIECGVNRGFGLMSWAKFSAILEPVNLTRRIYGFDSFIGFPSIHAKDRPANNGQAPVEGDLAADCYDELLHLITLYDQDRYLGHVPKVELIKGDAVTTIPQFIGAHGHLVVSLLFLDFDLYEPTRAAIEAFVPRMPRGAVIALDELDNPIWPGETMALLETVGIRHLKLERLDFDPYIAFAVIG